MHYTQYSDSTTHSYPHNISQTCISEHVQNLLRLKWTEVVRHNHYANKNSTPTKLLVLSSCLWSNKSVIEYLVPSNADVSVSASNFPTRYHSTTTETAILLL